MEVPTSYLQNCIILLMVDFSVLHARALALRPRCDPLPSFRELEECENITFPDTDRNSLVSPKSYYARQCL